MHLAPLIFSSTFTFWDTFFQDICWYLISLKRLFFENTAHEVSGCTWLYLGLPRLPWSASMFKAISGLGLGWEYQLIGWIGGWTSSLQSLLSPHNLLQLQGGQHSQHLRRKRQQTQLGYPHSCGSLWSTVCTGWKCNPRNMYLQTLDRVPAPWYQIQCNKFCRFISNKAQVYGCFNTELRSCVLVLSIAFVICKYRFIFKF